MSNRNKKKENKQKKTGREKRKKEKRGSTRKDERERVVERESITLKGDAPYVKIK